MRVLVRCAAALCVVLALAFPALAQNTGGLPGKELVLAGMAYQRSPLVVLKELVLAGRAYQKASRVVLHGNVVHYQFDVPVGPGPFDVIRMHRVVKEVWPGWPAKKMEGILLLPGLPQRFEAVFLQAPLPDHPIDQSSIALFLASNNIDVWGIDYGYSFVPPDATSFEFLSGWGVEKDAEHVQAALSIARWLRVMSMQGTGPMHLLGFSYGGLLVYAAAAEDTQRPGHLRNIKGIIPVDGTPIKVAPGSPQQLNACKLAGDTLALLGAGKYQFDFRASSARGLKALNDPDGMSPSSGGVVSQPPFLPFPAFPANTFTNFQFSQVNAVRNKTLGGTYTVSPPSVTLFFAEALRIVGLQAVTPPYYPNQIDYEGAASRCDSDLYPVAFDDHFAEVDVPIYYIARADNWYYPVTLVRSADVTTNIVNQLWDPSLYGHADFFLADDAASVIWQPILDWIRAHR